MLTKDGREVFGQSTKTWPEGFSELDGGRITGEDDRPIYEINVDNAYHLRYRRRAKSDAARDLISQKYITGMRLFLLGFENSRQNVAAACREGYARAYQTSHQRAEHLPEWTHSYNWHRPHGGIGSRRPISRLGMNGDNLLRLHN